jgi:predicted transcriptional regulator of viral defense system
MADRGTFDIHLQIYADDLYPQTMAGTLDSKLDPLLRRNRVIRTRDLARFGLPRTALEIPLADGRISRLSHGVYAVAGHDVSEHHSLAQAAVRVPHGVICLLSALVFHELTTQSPHEVWLAIDRKSRPPAQGYPPLHIVRFGGEASNSGISLHQIDGVAVPITNPAKTVADCFKYRNKIGIGIAVEALRDGWARRRFTMDELWAMARVCRMENVLRPYVESLA